MWLRSETRDRKLRSSGNRATVRSRAHLKSFHKPKRNPAIDGINTRRNSHIPLPIAVRCRTVVSTVGVNSIARTSARSGCRTSPKRVLKEKGRGVKAPLMNEVEIAIPDDCKENCWQDSNDLTLFDSTLNLKNQYETTNLHSKKVDEIGPPDDCINQFGVITYDSTKQVTATITSSCTGSNVPLIEPLKTKCITECDSTTEIDCDVSYPSTSGFSNKRHKTSEGSSHLPVQDLVVS